METYFNNPEISFFLKQNRVCFIVNLSPQLKQHMIIEIPYNF